MQNRKNIGLLIIATLKYKQFAPQLLEGVKKYYLLNHNITVFLFNDEYGEYEGDSRVKIEQHPIPSYKFPFASLYRYKIFCQYERQLSKMDYLFYSDIDMEFCDVIPDNILFDGLTMVYHPGFYSKKEQVGHWGSNGVVKESTAWVNPDKRKCYIAGGFNGGTTEAFLKMAKVLDERITQDEAAGVMAEFHDESHTNAYLKNEYKGDVLYLKPEYCMVEQQHLREAWGIDDLHPRIIALSKDHKAIRE